MSNIFDGRLIHELQSRQNLCGITFNTTTLTALALLRVFLVDGWQPVQDPDFFYQVTGSQGVYFLPPLELTEYPWFEQMKYHLANFSLGLTEITHTYARYFLSLAQDLSPAYRQANREGWFAP